MDKNETEQQNALKEIKDLVSNLSQELLKAQEGYFKTVYSNQSIIEQKIIDMSKKVDKTAQKGESIEHKFSSIDFISPDYVTSRFDVLEEKSVDFKLNALFLSFIVIFCLFIGYQIYELNSYKKLVDTLNGKIQNYDNFHNYLSTTKKIPVLKYIEEFESKTTKQSEN